MELIINEADYPSNDGLHLDSMARAQKPPVRGKSQRLYP